MAERIQRTVRPHQTPDPVDPPVAAPAGQGQKVGMEDILDEIDSVLEVNAQSFVQDFVQKGGQ